MQVLWESDNWSGSLIDPEIRCLSWTRGSDLGTGWLGAGSESGAVGITRTNVGAYRETSRFNFNLRGHHSRILFVSWNTREAKLATCDDNGIIYLWAQNDERWSVELVNDRGVRVRDFCWSPNGSSALICYEDNFVLVGSAYGQQIWSHSFPRTVLCGVWTYDSRQIILGLEDGNILLMNDHGLTIFERLIDEEKSIKKMACSSLESGDNRSPLCICFSNDQIGIFRSYDDPDPVIIPSTFNVISFQWSFNGKYLALVTTETDDLDNITNVLRFFNARGAIMQSVVVPVQTHLTAFTWANLDKAVILAAGGRIIVGSVVISVPKLALLSSHRIWRLIGNEQGAKVDSMPLPQHEKTTIKFHNEHIIQCRIPPPWRLRPTVTRPTAWRWHCTVRPVSTDKRTYSLCMEHMGGLVPVLYGRKVGGIRPQFEIGLPENAAIYDDSRDENAPLSDSFRCPTFQRTSMWRRSKRRLTALVKRTPIAELTNDKPAFDGGKLVHVSSNVWCTRFKITSIAPLAILPADLGQVVYKTSVFHLQPRKMTVHVADLEKQSTPALAFLSDNDDDPDDIMSPAPSASISPSIGEIFIDHRPLVVDQVFRLLADFRLAVEMHINRLSDLTTHLNHETPINEKSASNPFDFTLETIKFIDESQDEEEVEEDFDCQRKPLVSPCRRPSVDEIGLVLDTLHTIARHLNEGPKEDRIRNSVILAYFLYVRVLRHYSSKRYGIWQLRNQLTDIAQCVRRLERRIDHGNQLLGQVCRDLHQRMSHIRPAFNKDRTNKSSNAFDQLDKQSLVVLHNKEPSWNNQSNVYQLDFGGRVTQESAKNFQIEQNDRQVMQFGRIDNGAYTLDFCHPFTAVQAFSVALASITQRLK